MREKKGRTFKADSLGMSDIIEKKVRNQKLLSLFALCKNA